MSPEMGENAAAAVREVFQQVPGVPQAAAGYPLAQQVCRAPIDGQ